MDENRHLSSKHHSGNDGEMQFLMPTDVNCAIIGYAIIKVDVPVD